MLPGGGGLSRATEVEGKGCLRFREPMNKTTEKEKNGMCLGDTIAEAKGMLWTELYPPKFIC